MTPLSPQGLVSPLPPRPASPPTPTLRTPSLTTRQSRARLYQLAAAGANPKEAVLASSSAFPFSSPAVLSAAPDAVDIIPPLPLSSAPPLGLESMPEVAGTKRRHAAMMMDSASASTPPSTRRRTRLRSAAGSSREPQPHSPQDPSMNSNQGQDAMDVEEDGRERKRVARR